MSARARADAFARALDEGSAPPVVEALGAVRAQLDADLAPSAQFRAELRTRLMAVSAVHTTPDAEQAATAAPRGRHRRPRGWVRPLAAACAGVLVVVAALFGVSVAARNSLPGDTLYGAKRATEALQLRTTDGSLNQGIARLHLAEKRLAEVRALAARGDGQALGDGPSAAGSDAGLIRSTLAAMDDDTRTGSAMVVQVARETGNPAPLKVLRDWSGQQTDRIKAVQPVLPLAAQSRFEASLTLINGVRTTTTELLGGN